MPGNTAATQVLTDAHALMCVVVGIFVSIFLPVAVRALLALKARADALKLEANAEGPGGVHHPSRSQVVMAAARSYLGRGVSGLIYLISAVFVAAVIVYFLGMKFYTMRDALLAGFAWESLINKLYHGAPGTNDV